MTTIERLEERVRILAREKSYLQLITQMMHRASRQPGLENTVDNLLRTVLDCIGGTNISVYYRIETQFHYCDVFGKRAVLAEIADPIVRQVLQSGELVEIQQDPSDSQMLEVEKFSASTWFHPLKIGADIIGVFKMESMHIGTREWAHLLPTFFNYVALLLKNEILEHTQLAGAYEQLRREAAARKLALADLQAAKAELEINLELQSQQIVATSEDLRRELLERRRTEKDLLLSEARYRDLFEYSSVPIWEEDFSAVKVFFADLRRQGVTDFGEHFTRHPEDLQRCAGMVKVVDVNQESLRFFHLARKEDVIEHLPYYFTPATWEIFKDELVALAEGEIRFRAEIEIRVTQDELRTVSLHLSVAAGHEETLEKVHVAFIDISEQIRATRALQESENRFHTMFGSSPIAIELFNADGLLVDANPACLRLFGVSSLSDVLGFRLNEDPNVSAEIKERLLNNEVVRYEVPFDFEKVRRLNLYPTTRSGTIHLEVTITPLLGAGRSFHGMMAQIQDITERKRAGEALRQSEELFRQLAENVREGMWVRNYHSREVEYLNPAGEELVGMDLNTARQSPDAFLQAFHPEDQERLQNAIRMQYQGQFIGDQYRVLHPDGSVRWLRMRSYPVHGPDGTVQRIAGIAEDVTRAHEEELVARIEQQRIDSLLQISQNPALTIFDLEKFAAEKVLELADSPFGALIYANLNGANCLYGWMNRETGEVVRHAEKPICALDPRLSSGYALNEPARILDEEDSRRLLALLAPDAAFPNSHAMLVPNFYQDQLIGVALIAGKKSPYTLLEAQQVFLMVDEVGKILDRRESQEQLQASILEKNALIKEIHHRVKNNMQVMISLLDMQSLRVPDLEIREMFNECKNRIRSMSLVHEQLYSSSSLAKIDFASYVTRLSWDLMGVYQIHSNIRLNVEAETLYLPIEIAIPCGLIVNELVTNALKHAFPNERSGQVMVRLKQEEQNVLLSVADDGVGMPVNFDPTHSETLGMKLVHLLSRQVSGRMEIRNENGSVFELRFPI